MSLADPASPSPSSRSARGNSQWMRAPVVAAITVLLVLILMKGRVLWSEWVRLNVEWNRARTSAPIGYYNVQPHLSYASQPSNWYHHEGNDTLLWSGWKAGVGHQWFRVARGEVDRDRITRVFARDVIRAIERPIVEVDGGIIWDRIPDEAPVVSLAHEDVHTVYPLLLLEKVLVVNDLVGRQPFLVAYSPYAPSGHAVTIYDPVLDGERVVMGVSGYFVDREPMLYDRATESFWLPDDAGLKAISGRNKGARLRRLEWPVAVSWGAWRGRNSKGRLIAGADRSADKHPL